MFRWCYKGRERRAIVSSAIEISKIGIFMCERSNQLRSTSQKRRKKISSKSVGIAVAIVIESKTQEEEEEERESS